jgi:colanic acid/amylovoran biosynthesis glycosyltransferase
MNSPQPETLRICLSYPAPRPETFVRAHRERLQKVGLVLYDGIKPTRYNEGGTIMHGSGRGKVRDALTGMIRGRSLQQEHDHRITALLKRHKVQVVLAEYGYTGMELMAACRMAAVPLVAHFFGKDAHSTAYLERYGNYRQLFSQAGALVVVSSTMRDQLKVLGAPPEKIVHIACGVDVEKFHVGDPAAAPPHFIAVGRFVEKKAPHLTLMAFAEVLRTHPEARLTMVGDGRLWEACAQLVSALRLSDRVDLCGVRSPEEIVALKHRSRAFVQHSVTTLDGDSEGTPVAIQEAMSAGLPVIATRHAGIQDVIEDGRSGLLCDPFDIGTMAAHMRSCIDDPGAAKAIGLAARARALSDFPVERQIARLQDVLHRVVHGSPIHG